MVRNEHRPQSEMELHSGGSGRVLVIEAPYYQDITEALVAGAQAVLDAAGVGYDRVPVPGALEIPQALAQAVAAGLFTDGSKGVYAGVIALGCVIRGETSHYDIVCNNTNHWLMETAILNNIPVGNGVLTVDTHAQALARAQGGADGKGGDAARACLRLIRLAHEFGQRAS
ncbi:6,7-dimethyl-8-ribityllumazine synthase [Hyphomicrobium sp.]|uniref:6,7-dimethyl-8-ribityllumazine synthase n=1 Tax=Hyphomicrobium sp. TaxID=82 RepID=UPI0025BAE5A0|nr:6,7-dimethyl-8-ribityllumazine synthase [Hyphomicrobium sp.]MCC7251097.1 6,7-dimethyl-8-ribityllumazine synthase [Hyphomicrobium sp.]